MEEWKEIPGYEGVYEASDFGRIRSLDRKTVYKDGRVGNMKGQIMKPTVSSDTGYLVLNLTKNGKCKLCKVHVLVALTFHGECPEGMEVRHLDGVKVNAVKGNLKYGTPTENQADRVAHGTTNRGELCGTAKLSNADVIRIKALLSAGAMAQKDIAAAFGVSQATISSIKHGSSRLYG